MTEDEAIDIISNCLGPNVVDILLDGQPDGANPEWGYDEELIISIGKNCQDWIERVKKKTNGKALVFTY